VRLRVCLIIFAVGCAHWQRTELYFGLATPEGAVSAAEWQQFVDEEATPRLPDGFTVVDGAGQWRNQAGAITREPSRVLIVLHPATPRFHAAIEELRRRYAARFHQEAVLRADMPSDVSLK
jgi:hypothetical protein